MPANDPADVGVVFDLDGTLVDSEPFWRRGFSTGLMSILAARGHGDHPLQASEMHRFKGGRVPDTVDEILTWLGLSIDRDEFDVIVDETVRYVTEDFCARPVPVAQGVATARALHQEGIPLGLASSSSAMFIDAALAVLGLEQVFPVRVSAIDLPHGKPDPMVYFAVLARMGVSNGRALAIEDSTAGVAAAVNARIRCVWFRSPELEGGLPPDYAGDAAVLTTLVEDVSASQRLITETTFLSRDLVVGLLDRIRKETIEP